VWHATRSQLKGMTRARYTAVELVGEAGDVWQFSVPNDATRAKCAEYQADVEAAPTAAVGAPVKIGFVDPAGSPADDDAPRAESAPAAPAAAEPAPPAAPAAPAAPVERAVDRAVAAAAAAVDDEVVAAADLPPVPDDDDVDLSELTDAPPESVKTPIDRLAEAFPGSELVSED
jgi:hypothetical protein